MRKILLLALLVLGTVNVQASVWNHDPSKTWNRAWQERYAQWIRNEVRGDFFKSLGGPFARLKLDCADAHYALVAYFSRENGLPFAVAQGQLTNMTTRFDHIGSWDGRLAAFMDYMRAHYGTEALVHHDTIPPTISDLKPGDLFMWKTGSNGNYTRHTYIIKRVLANGRFDVLYSTQANAAQTGPLKSKSDYMFTKRPNHGGGDRNHWGFRRLKWPQEASVAQENIGRSNFEQYAWARQLSTFDFFVKIQEINQTSSQSPGELVENLFNTLCDTVLERISIVEDALAPQTRLGGACMNYQDYDAHSTPSRDSSLMQEFRTLKNYLVRFQQNGKLNQIPQELRTVVLAIYATDLNNQEKMDLYRYCPIKFGPRDTDWTDINSFQINLFAGRVSFHPNDNLYRRWGFPRGNKTNCKVHYGYPED